MPHRTQINQLVAHLPSTDCNLRSAMKLFTALSAPRPIRFRRFSPVCPNFEQTYLVRNGATSGAPLFPGRTTGPLARDGPGPWLGNVCESLATFAMPAGPTLQPVYEDLRDEILRDLAAAMPVDMRSAA